MKTLSYTQKYSLIILSILCALLISPLAFAQNPNATPEAREERAENRAEIREDARIRLSENLQNRIINLTENVTNRLSAVVARYENISARIDTRIEKLNTAGVDTTVAEERLNEAKTLIADAGSKIESLTSIGQALSGETPRESFAQVRTEILEIRATLRSAHQALLDTVSLLKEAVMQSEQGQGASDAVRQDDTETPSESLETE
jgi:hypothetical protein